MAPFRGMMTRDWKDLPYAEKLGLVASLSEATDFPRAVAAAVGLARARAPFVAEVLSIAQAAARLSSGTDG